MAGRDILCLFLGFRPMSLGLNPCRFKFDPLGMFKVQIEATRKHGGRQGERAYFHFVKGVTSSSGDLAMCQWATRLKKQEGR